MATADWKPVDQKPEEFGNYLVTYHGHIYVFFYGQPLGAKRVGWYIRSNTTDPMAITAWDYLPVAAGVPRENL